MRRLGCLLVCLSLAGLACSPKARDEPCSSDADCPAREACQGSACVSVECKADSECSGEQVCVGYECVDAGCTTDGQCEAGQVCEEGQCVVGCRTSRDCPGELFCLPEEGAHGMCVVCRTAADCEASDECIDHQCRAQCFVDPDCPDGYCDTDTGTCVECVVDAHCPSGSCDPVAHTCIVCQTKDECQLAELCIAGQCVAGCEVDRDCPDDLHCATELDAHGRCVQCTADQHCPGQNTCESYRCTGACTPDCTGRECGPDPVCHESCGECPVGEPCNLDGQCVACTPDCTGRECGPDPVCLVSCGDCTGNRICDASGQCSGCIEDLDCDFLELCEDGTCVDAVTDQTPYCQPCDNTTSNPCGDAGNPCLIYPYTNDEFGQISQEYCGVDCEITERCPSGFECQSIITIKQSDVCQSDADCPGGLPCLKAEDEDKGFCPCHASHNPCPQNTCITDICFGTVCLTSQLPCTTTEDCQVCTVTMDPCLSDADCDVIPCALYEDVDYGGCEFAKACGLAEGEHCPAP